MSQSTASQPTAAAKVNRRIEERIATRNFLDRLESAYVLRRTVISSPVIKRLYLRVFDHAQLNMHRISVYGRVALPEEKVVQVEGLVRKTLADTDAYLNEKLAECDALCKANGLSAQPQHLAPMQFDVRVISPLSNKYLKLLVKGDQVVSLIELLVIEDIVGTTRGDMLISEVRNRLRKVSTTARALAIGVIKLAQVEAQAKNTQVKPNGAEQHDEDQDSETAAIQNSVAPGTNGEPWTPEPKPRRRGRNEHASVEGAPAPADPPEATASA